MSRHTLPFTHAEVQQHEGFMILINITYQLIQLVMIKDNVKYFQYQWVILQSEEARGRGAGNNTPS